MPFTEDLSVFVQPNDFATAALYTPVSGSPATINVIFDNPGVEVFNITSRNPSAVAKTSDLPAYSNQDTLTVNGVAYRITDSQPIDDGAFTVLGLTLTS